MLYAVGFDGSRGNVDDGERSMERGRRRARVHVALSQAKFDVLDDAVRDDQLPCAYGSFAFDGVRGSGAERLLVGNCFGLRQRELYDGRGFDGDVFESVAGERYAVGNVGVGYMASGAGCDDVSGKFSQERSRHGMDDGQSFAEYAELFDDGFVGGDGVRGDGARVVRNDPGSVSAVALLYDPAVHAQGGNGGNGRVVGGLSESDSRFVYGVGFGFGRRGSAIVVVRRVGSEGLWRSARERGKRGVAERGLASIVGQRRVSADGRVGRGHAECKAGGRITVVFYP